MTAQVPFEEHNCKLCNGTGKVMICPLCQNTGRVYHPVPSKIDAHGYGYGGATTKPCPNGCRGPVAMYE